MTRIMSFLVICLATLSISFKTTDPLAESIKRGKDIYSVSCVACHQADGKGMENIFPPLTKSDYLMADLWRYRSNHRKWREIYYSDDGSRLAL